MSNSNAHNAVHSGAAHGSIRSYLIGFVLSVILTAASFFIVMGHGMESGTAIALIAVLALVQVVVHLVYFLHLSSSSEQSWNVMAFGFTVMTAVILIGGSIWIMHNVSMNMMSR
jgi:cytochrome o ubiquinol oxidase operon protein cyoD